MLLLTAYVLFALIFSFLCSIAEAVILSINSSYIAVLEQDGRPSGRLLREMKEDVGKPLAAILTLNTIAHTVGAVGAGAQAAQIFGNAYLGVASAVLTLLILIFSEIIPKTLGALHWRRLAPVTAHGLRFLIWVLYPLIWMTEKMTGGMSEGMVMTGFSRREFEAMADLSQREGRLGKSESETMKNVLRLRTIQVSDVMTPRPVVFAVSQDMSVDDYFTRHSDSPFSRVPLHGAEKDQLVGFVLRSDALASIAQGQPNRPMSDFARELPALPEALAVDQAFRTLNTMKVHIAMIVDEYGDLQGILTLEDIIETLMGLEIVDEADEIADLRVLARQRWEKKAIEIGFNPAETPEE